MPGTFSRTNLPRRAGAYVRFESAIEQAILPAPGSIVAIPLVHDWGPKETATFVRSLNEFQNIFGEGITAGYNAVQQAFRGEGVGGVGGAGGVLVYRMVGTAGAKAAHVLTNTMPATALTLTAIYEGSRGNDLKVTVQDHAGGTTYDELLILDGSTVLERYIYLNADIADLVAQINLVSAWVTATLAVDDVALTNVSAQAFTAGEDGATLVVGNWTAALDALDVERFGIIVPYDLTDDSILASVKTWAQGKNEGGKRFLVVIGGDGTDTLAEAVDRSSDFNDPNFVNIGVSQVVDAQLLDESGDPVALTPAQLAPRIAGVLARRGEAQSISFARLAGLTITTGPTDAEVLTAYDGGVVVLTRGSDSANPTRIEKGLTTWTIDNDDTQPYLIFSRPKFVLTMQGIDAEVSEYAELNIIGKLPVNAKSRAAVIGYLKSILQRREDQSIIQPGWTVDIDRTLTTGDDDEFLAFSIGLAFGRSAEQVFFSITVS